MNSEIKPVKIGDIITHPQKFQIIAADLAAALNIKYDGKLTRLAVNDESYGNFTKDSVLTVEVESLTEDKLKGLDYKDPAVEAEAKKEE